MPYNNQIMPPELVYRMDTYGSYNEHHDHIYYISHRAFLPHLPQQEDEAWAQMVFTYNQDLIMPILLLFHHLLIYHTD